jgi:uncharacterized membrane protein
VTENARAPSILQRRWRSLLGAAIGVAGFVVAYSHGLPPGLSSLIGWNFACLVFLTTTGWMMWRDDEPRVRARAAYEDEGETLTLTIVLIAVAASLGAAVMALQESKAAGVHVIQSGPWPAALSFATLVLGWFVVQSVFTLRYTHRYFGDGDNDGEIDGGIKFPGQEPRTYLDFVYLAICVGATAQVSDVSITTPRYRNLVTQHAVVAFFYNTMVLALGINILASIIGH